MGGGAVLGLGRMITTGQFDPLSPFYCNSDPGNSQAARGRVAFGAVQLPFRIYSFACRRKMVITRILFF